MEEMAKEIDMLLKMIVEALMNIDDKDGGRLKSY